MFSVVCIAYQTLKYDWEINLKFTQNITIIGAADSATGTADINNTLGKARANFIANALKERGVPSSQITKRNQGGTNEYFPAEANRQTKGILHYNWYRFLDFSILIRLSFSQK